KAEVPLKGQGEDVEIRRRSAQLTEAITGPWFVLSSGVPQDRFPATVRLAMSEGADGFLAGRAVWSGCIGQPDVEQALRTDAATRLQSLAQLVDEQMAARACPLVPGGGGRGIPRSGSPLLRAVSVLISVCSDQWR